MSRPLRVEFKNAWYHVINHGIIEQSIFKSEHSYNEFFILLGDLSNTYQVEVHAYSLLKNEYHLLIRTPSANLSDAMRYLNGVYTQRHNRLARRNGPLFRGRYKAVVVNEEMYLLQVSRFIHWIPVKEKYCQYPHDYRFSSCRAYIGKEAGPNWLYRDQVLDRFKNINAEKLYLSYLELGVDNVMEQFYSNKRLSPVLGPKSFKKKIVESLMSSDSTSDIPELQRILHKPSICEIANVVHTYVNEIKAYKKKSSHMVRNIAMIMCRDIGGYSLKEIAGEFNLGHHHSVSVIISRTRKIIQSDLDLTRLIKLLYERLNNEL